jgi:decaprenylphospho-beta-D-ribofuranose 2-oxidase
LSEPATSPSRLSVTASTDLVSFDGGVRRREALMRPDRYRDLMSLPPGQPRSVRGGGYSYAAAGFGGGGVVQDARAFNRIVAFDESTGLLECEGATTLGKVFTVAAPRGWYLPVQPGYPDITIGGCIATDAHGKNQLKDGAFRQVVTSLDLYHPRHGVLRLDRQTDGHLLELTCGGLGLTGHVLRARLQLARIPEGRVRIWRERIARFEDTLTILEAQAARADLIYTWHDFTSRGGGFGRGFAYAGRFVPGTADPRPGRVRSVDARTRARFRVQLLNGATTRAFNRAYELWQFLHPAERDTGLFHALFPVARKVVYFELFGSAGFHECQILVPRDRFPALARSLREYLDRHRTPVTLASCKLFSGTQRYLRFEGPGLCLALDFPRGDAGMRFAAFLDGLVRDLGARPNVSKDSRLPRDVVAACYPEYEAFRDALRAFDPDRVYRSEVSERLGL